MTNQSRLSAIVYIFNIIVTKLVLLLKQCIILELRNLLLFIELTIHFRLIRGFVILCSPTESGQRYVHNSYFSYILHIKLQFSKFYSEVQ